jgi:hypothetical protein
MSFFVLCGDVTKTILQFRTLNVDKLYKKQATPHFAGCHINIL